MRGPLVAAALLCGALAAPAHAGLTEAELAGVTLAPPPGARAPLGLHLRDEAGRPLTLGEASGGRPTVLLLADYTCGSLCGAATAVRRTKRSTSAALAARAGRAGAVSRHGPPHESRGARVAARR